MKMSIITEERTCSDVMQACLKKVAFHFITNYLKACTIFKVFLKICFMFVGGGILIEVFDA